jgi:glycosyl transferase family 25
METLKHLLYINLEHRPDRKEHFLNEMNKLDIPNIEIERFNAVKNKNGALGCSMSHLKCIQYAKQKNWDNVIIMEDDITFLEPSSFLDNLSLFLTISKGNWDVLLLAGNNMIPYKKINSCCIQVFNCITTTGYIVQKHYYDTLIENYREGILKLMKEPEKKDMYAIDKYWLNLQMDHKWFMIVPPTVVQYENYSDIEEKDTNFNKFMLDYNKVNTQFDF